jgi:hypothetical protein
MDGMKLDEEYRQKNGLGPAAPEPNSFPKKQSDQRLTFDSESVNKAERPPQPITSATVAAGEDGQPGGGFIDKVLFEKNHPKSKKKKLPKAPKIAPKPEPAPKPKPAKKPKPQPKPPAPQIPPPPPAPPTPPKPVQAPATKPPKQPKPVLRGDLTSQLIVVGKVVIFVAIVIFCLYNYVEVQRLNDLLGTEVGQQSQNDTKNQELIDTIGSFRLLPDSEYEVYTVKDKAKLIDDPVFEKAENGDKVVIYPSDSLTIIYRESEGRIISESNNSKLTEKK